MSEAEVVVELPSQAKESTSRLEAMYAGDDVETVDESDTSGIPDNAVDLDAGEDGNLAATDEDGDDSDTDDGTPDEDESDESGFEQRFKDTQAALTERSQELSAVKTEYAGRMESIADSEQQLEHKLSSLGEYANYRLQGAQQQLQQMGNQPIQQMNQQEYAGWQNQVASLQQFIAQETQHRDAFFRNRDATMEESIQRKASIARDSLNLEIDDFKGAYPEIGRYAVSRGVNERVFMNITDPGLIKIIHEAMTANTAPDTIEVVSKKSPANRRLTRNRTTSTGSKPKSLAERMYRN